MNQAVCAVALMAAAFSFQCTKSSSDETKPAKRAEQAQSKKKRSSKSDDDRQQKANARWRKAEQSAVKNLAQAWEKAPPSATTTTAKPGTPTSGLEVYFFNVGHADSMLVVGPPPGRKTLLIDLGQPTRRSRLPSKNFSSMRHVAQRIGEITGKHGVDYFVLSNFASEHAGSWNHKNNQGSGIVGLLSDASIPFSVGTFIDPGTAGAKYMPGFRRSYETVTARMPIWVKHERVGKYEAAQFGSEQIQLGPKAGVEIVAVGGKVASGESAFERAEKNGANYKKAPGHEGDLSIAMEISYGEFELFTAGDVHGSANGQKQLFYHVRRNRTYTNVENVMAHNFKAQERESDVEIYRASLHGSGYSSTEALLNVLDPEFIVYSTGGDQKLPRSSTLARGAKTAQQFATTWVADADAFQKARGRRVGEVKIVVTQDGKHYQIEAERFVAYTDDAERRNDDAKGVRGAPGAKPEAQAKPAAVKTKTGGGS
jgi:beta-lactamase superfamily II metal-dependent hydrolase